MRKRLSIALLLACALMLLPCLTACSPMDNIPTRAQVRSYDEADFRAHFRGVHRDGLIEVWGAPDATWPEEHADLWDIDEECLVVVYWRDNDRFLRAGVNIK